MTKEFELSDEMVDRLFKKFKDLEGEIVTIAGELALKASEGDEKIDLAVFTHVLASLYLKMIVVLAESYSSIMTLFAKFADEEDNDD